MKQTNFAETGMYEHGAKLEKSEVESPGIYLKGR
jgi:hypothetical protein